MGLHLTLAVFAGALLASGAAAWIAKRRSAHWAAYDLALSALVERIAASRTIEELAEVLSKAFPDISRATSLCLYVYNSKSRCLERVATPEEPEPMAASIDNPPEGLAGTAVSSFLEKSFLSVPDIRNSPLVQLGAKAAPAKSAMLVPIVCGDGKSALGVVEYQCAEQTGFFPEEDQDAAKHIARILAVTLQLLQSKSAGEQFERSRQQAGADLAFAGLASELVQPIEALAAQAMRLEISKGAIPSLAEEIGKLSAQAQEAAKLASRLASVSQGGEMVPIEPVDLHATLRKLLRIRQAQAEEQGIEVKSRVEETSAVITGVANQLEQAVLHFLMYAENRAQESEEKILTVESRKAQGKASIQIGYSVPRMPAAKAEENPLLKPGLGPGSLGRCREAIEEYRGSVQFFSWLGHARLEIELPVEAEPERTERGVPQAAKPLTVMLVEPDANSRRALLVALGERGHRVIPAHAEEVGDMLDRASFDTLIWAVRQGGARWADIREKSGSTPVILLSDGYDRDLARSMEESGNFLLKRPWEDVELDRVLSQIGARPGERLPQR